MVTLLEERRDYWGAIRGNRFLTVAALKRLVAALKSSVRGERKRLVTCNQAITQRWPMIVVAIALVTLPAASAQTPTAESLLDRYVEVTGGVAAYHKPQAQVTRSTIRVTGTQFEASAITYQTRAGQYYSVLNTPLGRTESGVLGDYAWEFSTSSGARLKKGPERLRAIRAARMLPDAEWRKYYSGARIVEKDEVEGRPCYVVSLVETATSEEETRCFDTDTGLLLKTTGYVYRQGVRLKTTSIWKDYREVAGIRQPHGVTMQVGSDSPMSVTITEIQFPPDLPTGVFKVPPEINRLIADARDTETAPSVESILTREIDEVGGADALRHVATFKVVAHLQIAGSDKGMVTNEYRDGAGRSYELIKLPDGGSVETGNNGDVIWEKAGDGVHVKDVATTPGEFLTPAPFLDPTWQTQLKNPKLLGTALVNGSPCYQIQATLVAGGLLTTRCFDKETGLLVKVVVSSPDGTAPSQVEFSDYRKVGNIRLPFRAKTKIGDQDVETITEDVELNPKLPRALTELPADVQAEVVKVKKATGKE